MKYPLSIQDSLHDGKMSVAFYELLSLHAESGAKILDPTAGKHLLWEAAPKDELKTLGMLPFYDITFSDIEGGPGNEMQNLSRARVDRSDWFEAFDCVVYDPPYLIGENETDDPREKDYGTYAYSTSDLAAYMDLLHTVIPDLLKPKGKVILKCSDQYVVKERKFYPFHYKWMNVMVRDFEIIDIMIYRHHRMSPTAFQVKNRPCCVIMHTYYIVGQLLEFDKP